MICNRRWSAGPGGKWDRRAEGDQLSEGGKRERGRERRRGTGATRGAAGGAGERAPCEWKPTSGKAPGSARWRAGAVTARLEAPWKSHLPARGNKR